MVNIKRRTLFVVAKITQNFSYAIRHTSDGFLLMWVGNTSQHVAREKPSREKP
jgi:hypothetical protein